MAAADYITRAYVKEELELGSDTGWDATLDRLITRASRHIDRLCNVQDGAFVQQTQTRYFDIDPKSTAQLFLPERLQAVTTLKTDEDGDHTYEVTWATTDYLLYPLDGPPYNEIRVDVDNGDYLFPTGQKRVQIVGAWGESGATAPGPIVEATLLLTSRWFARRKTPEGVVGSEAGFLAMGKHDPDVLAILREGGYARRQVFA